MHAAAITVNSTVAMYSQVIDPAVPGASPPRPRGARECMRLRLRQAGNNRVRCRRFGPLGPRRPAVGGADDPGVAESIAIAMIMGTLHAPGADVPLERLHQDGQIGVAPQMSASG